MYELFFEGSVNVDAAFRTEHQALTALRNEYARHGRDYVARWMLAEYKRGRYRLVAEGDQLADLVSKLPPESVTEVRRRASRGEDAASRPIRRVG